MPLERMTLEDLAALKATIQKLHHAGQVLMSDGLTPVFDLSPGQSPMIHLTGVTMPLAWTADEAPPARDDAPYAWSPATGIVPIVETSPFPPKPSQTIRISTASPPPPEPVADDASPVVVTAAAGGLASIEPHPTAFQPPAAPPPAAGAAETAPEQTVGQATGEADPAQDGGGDTAASAPAEDVAPAPEPAPDAAPAPTRFGPAQGPTRPALYGLDLTIWQHLDANPPRGRFDAAADLEMIEAFCQGQKANSIATDMGLDTSAIVARFRQLTPPICDQHGRPTIEGLPRLARIMRLRSDAPAQAAE